MMNGPIIHRKWYLRIFHHLVRIVHPKPKTDLHQIFDRLVNLSLGDQAVSYSIHERSILPAACKVRPRFDRQRRRFRFRRDIFVTKKNIVDRTAIGNDMAIKLPLLKKIGIFSDDLTAFGKDLTAFGKVENASIL